MNRSGESKTQIQLLCWIAIACGLSLIAGCGEPSVEKKTTSHASEPSPTQGANSSVENTTDNGSKTSESAANPTAGDESVSKKPSNEKPNRPKLDSNPSYSDQPTSELERYEQLIAYESFPATYFEETPLDNLDDLLQSRIRKLVSQVLSKEPDRTASPARSWRKLQTTAATLTKRISKSDKQVLDDPVVALAFGILAMRKGEMFEARDRLERAARMPTPSRYPQRTRVLAFRLLSESHQGELEPDTAAQLLGRYSRAIIQWLKEDFQAPPEQHFIVSNEIRRFRRYCLDYEHYEIAHEFQNQFAQIIDLPTWVRHMTRGNYFAEQGLKNCRFVDGKIVALNTTEVTRNLKKAVAYLKKAHKTNPMFPDAATEMMYVSRYAPIKESFDKWFMQSLKAQPDSRKAHMVALNNLRPAAGGSLKKMLEFAQARDQHEDADEGSGDLNEAKKTTTALTLLDCFFHLNEHLEPGTEEHTDFVENTFLKDRIFEIVSQFSERKTAIRSRGKILPRAFFLTLRAAMELEKNQLENADNTFRLLGSDHDKLAMEKLKIPGTTFNVFCCEPYALRSEYQTEAEELKELISGSFKDRLENVREISELCENVLQENENPIGSLFFLRAKLLAELESRYEQGDTIKIPFDPFLVLWKSRDISQLNFESEYSAIIDNRLGPAQTSMTSILNLPGPKSVSLKFEMLDNPDRPVSAASIAPGIVINRIGQGGMGFQHFAFAENDEFEELAVAMREQLENTDPLVVGISGMKKPVPIGPGRRKHGRLFFGNADQPEQLFHYRFDLVQTVNELTMRSYQGYFEVFVNDQFVFRSTSERLAGPSNLFQLLQAKSETGRGRIRISDIRVTKLPGERPPFYQGDDQKALIEFFKKQIEDDIDKAWNHLWLGQTYRYSGANELALEEYRLAIQNGLEKSNAGLFIGDVLERLGQMDQAMDWYKIGAKKNQFDSFRLFPRGKDRHGNWQHWASFRYAWNILTSEDESVRNTYNAEQFTNPQPPEVNDWMGDILKAQKLALQGKFQSAERLTKSALVHCSPKEEARVIEILNSFRTQKPWTRNRGKKPLYQLAKIPLPYHRDVRYNMPLKIENKYWYGSQE